MQLLRSRVLWGVMLILGGIALLLESLDVFRIGGFVWAVILGLVGLVFLSEYLNNKAHWWPLIPGISLLSIALAILLDSILPSLGNYISGFIILAGIGLSFVLIYLNDRANWWAVIPGGVMITIGLVSILDNFDLGFDTGGLFVIGIGLTFFVLTMLPGLKGQMKWAYIPGVVLLIVGVAILAATEQLFNYVWPVLLVLGGAFLAGRALLSGKRQA